MASVAVEAYTCDTALNREMTSATASDDLRAVAYLGGSGHCAMPPLPNAKKILNKNGPFLRPKIKKKYGEGTALCPDPFPGGRGPGRRHVKQIGLDSMGGVWEEVSPPKLGIQSKAYQYAP